MEELAIKLLLFIICMVILIGGYFYTVGRGWYSERLFGGAGVKVTSWNRIKQVRAKYTLSFFYALSLVLIYLFYLMGGEFHPTAFSIFYFYSAILAYTFIYYDIKEVILEYKWVLRAAGAVVFSLVIIMSDTLVDKDVANLTTLPAVFFPTSQPVLVFMMAALVFTFVFYWVSLVFYIYSIVVMLWSEMNNKNIKFSRFLYHFLLFILFLFLNVGILKIYKDVFGDKYSQLYQEAFIHFSYKENQGTCENLDGRLFVSFLRTGGVSVAYKKEFGDYYYSVDKCERKMGSYPVIDID